MTVTAKTRLSRVPTLLVAGALGFTLTAELGLAQQTTPAPPPPAPAPTEAPPAVVQQPAPPGYVIGPDDVLSIVFWREQDMSGEVVVRPDGMISLPLINDIQAAGLTPEQLRQQVEAAAARFVQDPTATVVVRQINSRKVFITGQVRTPGPYSLTSKTTVLQLIAMAGGLLEFADKGDIVVMRTQEGQTESFEFDYDDVRRGRDLEQNIELLPGDTVIVP